MKKRPQLRQKAKAAIVLFVLMVLLMLNNIAGRESYLSLNRSLSSIYQDRLMPATYLFQISDHLYQKRLFQTSVSARGYATESLTRQHDKAISALIDRYEKTYLTKEEQKQWRSFKQNLNAYNAAVSVSADVEFNKVIHSLNDLTQLQVGEGAALQKNAKAIILGSTMMSRFEICILLMLGILAVVLISTPDKVFAKPENYSLN